MNLHDAEITSLYVSEDGSAAGIEDDAPNFPAGGKFRVNLVMVAGGAVTGPYELVTTCTDVTDCAPAPALNPALGALNGTGAFIGPRWVANPPLTDKVFNHSEIVTPPPLPVGHVYRYTAALHSASGEITSVKQSDLFILK